jgi:hypothetical protein
LKHIIIYDQKYNSSMDENANLDQLTLRLEDDEELNALTLTTLLNSGVEEALSNLSPAQLIQLEKNVQKLKKQKSTTPAQPRRKTDTIPKRRKSTDESDEAYALHSSGGQYMNLPASAPHIEVRDGIEYLLFTYSTKGHRQEFCINIEIDDLTLEEIPEDFKHENCVYPSALLPREAYLGNRYDYEISVNDLAWKLTWLNAPILSGKRGLIQRAVDSYRNRIPETRSRRVLRQEKLHSGTLRRRTADSLPESGSDSRNPRTITLTFNSKGETNRMKIRVDIENADINEMDDDFRRNNCIYPMAMVGRDAYPGNRFEYEAASNELAWKLAWLNAQKLTGKKNFLQRAVEAYRAKFETDKHKTFEGFDDLQHMDIDSELAQVLMDKSGEDFSEMVAHTLQQALSHHDLSASGAAQQLGLDEHLEVHDLHDDHPQTVSTAELMGSY